MSPRVTDALSRIVLLAGAAASVATSNGRPLCDDDDECTVGCQWDLDYQARLDAEAVEDPPTLTATDCSLRQTSLPSGDVSERPHCDCEDALGTHYDLWGGDGHCLVAARNARCLLSATELPRDLCVAGDTASCTATCADLEARLIEDAARPVNRTLLDADCDFQCSCVVDIDGLCFRFIRGVEQPGPSNEISCP